MNILSPSILAADFGRLAAQLEVLEKNDLKWVHIDVMDGMFVPSISFGMPVIASIRKQTGLFFDTHLMVVDPDRYIKDFKKAGSDLLTVHVEACKDVSETLKKIKAEGMKAGISLNPETDVKALLPYVKEADLVLVMSVHPGFGGQKFIPETLEKARVIKKEIEACYPTCRLEMDGGINVSNLKEILASGVDTIVAGTAVFDSSIGTNIKMFKDIMNSEK